MSFQYPKIIEIDAAITRHVRQLECQLQSEGDDSKSIDGAREQLKIAAALQRKCTAWLESVHNDSACDYIETRTGNEVILGLSEMGATEYGTLVRICAHCCRNEPQN